MYVCPPGDNVGHRIWRVKKQSPPGNNVEYGESKKIFMSITYLSLYQIKSLNNLGKYTM